MAYLNKSTGPDTGMAPAADSPVTSAISSLRGAIQRLGETSDALRSQLQPLTTPTEPGATPNMPVRSGDSPAVLAIDECTHQVAAINEMLRDAASKLEI